MCGRDAGVVEYIERCSEAHHYWTHVRSLANAQIEEYLREYRGPGDAVVRERMERRLNPMGDLASPSLP